MKTLTINHSNGNSTTYQLIEGDKPMSIAYHKDTNKKVVEALEYCRKNRIRVKLNLGNIETGESWNDVYDVTGYIGLSKGFEAYFPILVYNTRSMGGGSILDHCILEIKASKGGKIFYKHDKLVTLNSK